MTNQTLAAPQDPIHTDIDTPRFWGLVAAYGRDLQGNTSGGDETTKHAILEHIATLRTADKHALWCAEVNLDGANEHLAEVQRDLATARETAFEEAARTVEAHSLAEKLARMTMANPVSHALNLVGVIAKAVRALKGATAPNGTRIPVPLVDSPLAREIEADAAAFEAAIGEKPERVVAPSYPWGWRYVTDKAHAGFLAWCRGEKPQLTNPEKRNG